MPCQDVSPLAVAYSHVGPVGKVRTRPKNNTSEAFSLHGRSHELIHKGKRSSLAHVGAVSEEACFTWRAGMDGDWPASHASCHHFQTARHAS
ncbi:hypothetical protein MTO96_012297 [Rhipicephalus appendiculatus]